MTAKVKSKRYANRKARMAKDPEYRKQVLRGQTESRRRATQARWEEMVAKGQACNWNYPNGRHCWKPYAHTHGGGAVYVKTLTDGDLDEQDYHRYERTEA